MGHRNDHDLLAETARGLAAYEALLRGGNGVEAERALKAVMARLPSVEADGVASGKPGKAAKRPAREVTQDQLDQMELAVASTAPKSRRAEGDGHPFWDKVMPLFEEHRQDFLQITRRLALMLHRKLGRPITVDDIRDYYPPPAKYDSRVMGGIFAERSVWRKVGEEKSKRAECHHRTISLFDRV